MAQDVGPHPWIAVIEVAEGGVVVGAAGAVKQALLAGSARPAGGGGQARFRAAQAFIAAAHRPGAPGGVAEIGPSGAAFAGEGGDGSHTRSKPRSALAPAFSRTISHQRRMPLPGSGSCATTPSRSPAALSDHR